jgi:hypothetical protein
MFHYHIQNADTAICGIGVGDFERDDLPGLTAHMSVRSFLVLIPGTEWGAGHIHGKDEDWSSLERPHCPTCKSGAKMLAFNPQHT